ncbi:MAG: pilus assembly protein [Chloroflexi bacterium]|nr:MAG: pilus assembly protein [Chloroflexota bacterium]
MRRRFVDKEAGQGTVEFALVLAPILILLVFGLVELANLLSSAMTMSSATREGARLGGALVNGGGTLGCSAGQSPNAATVDANIVAAVERVLMGAGARVTLADVTEIRIWKATASGQETAGQVNVWTYQLNGGPVIDGQALDFRQQSQTWQPCSRTNIQPVDSVGVTVRYTYRARTPISFLVPYFTSIAISDRTVMAMNVSK